MLKDLTFSVENETATFRQNRILTVIFSHVYDCET
jgi:hypothetical protein